MSDQLTDEEYARLVYLELNESFPPEYEDSNDEVPANVEMIEYFLENIVSTHNDGINVAIEDNQYNARNIGIRRRMGPRMRNIMDGVNNIIREGRRYMRVIGDALRGLRMIRQLLQRRGIANHIPGMTLPLNIIGMVERVIDAFIEPHICGS